MAKLKVTNLTRSPYDLPVVGGGKVRLGALASVEGDFSGQYFSLLQATKTVKVEIIDGDAKAPTVTVDPLKELRDMYQNVVGKKAYHGWTAEELQEKINEALEGE